MANVTYEVNALCEAPFTMGLEKSFKSKIITIKAVSCVMLIKNNNLMLMMQYNSVCIIVQSH